MVSFNVSLLVDCRYLFYPATTVVMFQIQNGLFRPVKVIGYEGYLLE